MDEPLGAIRDDRRLAQSRADVSTAPPGGATAVRIRLQVMTADSGAMAPGRSSLRGSATQDPARPRQ